MRSGFARWWPRTRASLRVRVAIAAAIAAGVVVAALMVLASIALAGNDAEQLDRRLDAIVDASTEPGSPAHAVLSTGRAVGTGEVVYQRGLQLPKLPDGTETVRVNGVDYRVRTVTLEEQGVTMSIGIRADSILLDRARLPLYIGVGVLALLIALGLGWLLGGAATRPLRKLTEQTRLLGQGGADRIDPVRGVKEAEDLSEAMIDTLRRLAAAQEATTRSLQAAQDFAANAAHELRTPLTAMRADLDTLRIHDLPAEERAEVVADLSRAQRRIEATITALGQLASGQLAQDEDRELVDLEELLDRVVRENARPDGPEIEVHCEFATPAEGVILAWPGGLRLAVDNLVRNSVLHGQASRIVLTARREGNRMLIIVDDNGRGLPEEEHATVLGRFVRGSTAAAGGSGLGLALVAQQAHLHGGGVELADGPLGGLRVILTLASGRP
ncbi:HAMP domain-containing sensor histidine kinase [[Mycobacterium] wendilense]|uniref:Signal transduction histidine-protein kinase/phosphatase MprB n=1 Tax=[Mycobacterium] wendilense TaxID=3064284 RepID=A0ABM9MJ31_9MYCO|nr:HAMP domain-containing sensor histidine kinase [Mycolicibacterium sp. MU0050]CAJ1586405.1 HAMP domain-containing sensor histidine kinase [Mycolicibacterium sp. MU0050]